MSEGKPEDVNPYESPNASDDPAEAEIIHPQYQAFKYETSEDEYRTFYNQLTSIIPLDKLVMFPPGQKVIREKPAVGDVVIVMANSGAYRGTIQAISGNDVTVVRD